jgi:hypothetical protein
MIRSAGIHLDLPIFVPLRHARGTVIFLRNLATDRLCRRGGLLVRQPDIIRYRRRWFAMPDVLIRDIPEAVLAEVDAHAARLGISRVEYIRRRLTADAATLRAQVTAQHLRKFADRFADLADDEVMDTAWR